jgi:GAF domain-containing protein
MSREAWQEFQATRQQAAAGYLFDQTTVRPITRDELELPGHEPADETSATALTTDHRVVLTPLAVSGESIGSLGIYADPDHPLVPEDQEFLDEVAAQVAEALERARLLEQLELSLAATETLYQVSSRISEARNLQEVMAAVMKVSSISAIKRAVLFALEQDSAGEVETMTVVANWYSGEGTEPTAIGTRLSKAMFTGLNLFLTSEPLFIGDVQHDDRIEPAVRPMLQQGNIRAMAVVPLWMGSRHVGSLTLEAEEIYEFSDQDIRLIRSLADQAAVAIDNQRLLEESQAALVEVEATQRRYTLQAWETYRASKKTPSYEQVREGSTPLGNELPPEVSQAVAQRQTTVISSPPVLSANGNESRPASVDELEQAGTDTDQESTLEASKSSLIVPLTVRDEVIGVLGLQETDEARLWSPEEVALVEAISEQLVQAAEQLRLFDESQERAARERRVAEIGDKIRAAQSLEEALQVAIKEVGLSLKASQTMVRLDVK